MKTNIVLARRLVTIFIGMCIITFSSAWDYPWEETSVYGTWDAPNMTYVIEKSQNPTCIEIDLLERAEEILKAIYLNNLKESKENKS